MGDLANLPAFAAGTTYTHADFNAAFAALTLATSFHTGKATLSAYATSTELTVYDPASASFKKGTLGNVVFSNDELVFNRTNNTTPLSTLIFLAQDPATKAFTKVPRENLFGGMFAFANVLAASGGLTSTAGNELAIATGGVTPARLAAKACTPAKIQGVYDSGWITSTCTLVAAGSATHAHGLAALPGEVTVWLQLGIGQQGWSAGDVLPFTSLVQDVVNAYPPPYVGADTTNIYLCTAAGLNLPHKTTGAGALLTDVGSLNRIRIVARLTEQTGI